MIETRWQQINVWYQTSRGQALLAELQRWVQSQAAHWPAGVGCQIGLREQSFLSGVDLTHIELYDLPARQLPPLRHPASVPIAEQFDVLLLCHVLECVPHTSRVLANAYRMLRPGGVLCVFTFNPYSIARGLSMLGVPDGLPPRLLCRSTGHWTQALRKVNFTITDIDSCGYFWLQSLGGQLCGRFVIPRSVKRWLPFWGQCLCLTATKSCLAAEWGAEKCGTVVLPA